MPRVYNKSRDKIIPPDAVYVGRPSKWGNPFKVYPWRRGGMVANRIAVESYREYLLKERPDLIEDAKRELKGKDLVCWCAPYPCHADILLELANG